MYPRQSPTTHTEQLGDEVAVYDRALAKVHALNPTAACVWRQCDGATSPEAIAAAFAPGDGYPRGRCGRGPYTRATRAPSPAGAARSSRVGERTDNDPALAARGRRRGSGDPAGGILDRGAISLVKQSGPLPATSTLTSGIAKSRQPGRLLGGHADRHQLRRWRHGRSRRRWRRDGHQRRGGQHDVADGQLCDWSGHGFRVPHGDVLDARRTSDPQTFTINVSTGSTTFNFTGSDQSFPVPAGVVDITILATGAPGGLGFGALGGAGGLGGRATATLSITPGASLTVRVGGVSPNGAPAPVCDCRMASTEERNTGNAGGGGGA